MYVLQGLCSLLCGNAHRQPLAAVGERSLFNYLGKGRCGIAQASNIECKSVSISPEDKHALLDCLSWGQQSCVLSLESWNNNKDNVCQL